MEEFEAYALGKKEKYEASAGEVEAFRKKYEELAVLLSEAEDQARAYGRMKEHKAFAVRKLTPELLDEYVESIGVYPGDEIRIRWK